MGPTVTRLSLVFAAAALGGLINGLVVWLFGWIGITKWLGVAIAPPLTPAMLYARIVWGGIWGILFLLPLWRGSIWWRGFWFSLGPTLVQLFIVFPVKAHKGVLGLQLGYLTPLFVVFFNAVWGWTAAAWLRASGER
jgi:hypothetical protein